MCTYSVYMNVHYIIIVYVCIQYMHCNFSVLFVFKYVMQVHSVFVVRSKT